MQFGNPIVNVSVNGPLPTKTAQILAQDFTALANLASVSLPLSGFTYPSGYSANNYHTLILSINGALFGPSQFITVRLVQAGGSGVGFGTKVLWEQIIGEDNVFIASNFVGNVTIPIPLTFGGNTACFLYILNQTGAAIQYSIVLDQNQSGLAALITDVQPGVFFPIVGGSNVGVGGYEYGGVTEVAGTIASTALTQILATPAGNSIYRLHSFCATTTNQILTLTGTTQPLAVVTAPQFIFLGGILCNTSLSIKASANVNMAYNLRYDLLLNGAVVT